jgi:hypothetical protein
METGTLDRIRFVTRHFNDLQGLRYWVPLGLLTLSVGGTTYFANLPFVILRFVFFLGAVLLAFGARRYYRNAFGEVEPQPVHPIREHPSVSIYSPAGSTSRLAGFREVPPEVRYLLIPLGLAVILFVILRMSSPALMVEVDESLIQPPWAAWNSVFRFAPVDDDGSISVIALSPTTAKAVYGQLMYALLGACFLGVWLWRERRWSQSYYLALGALLLGLSAFGASLGNFIGIDGRIAPIADFLLPAVSHLWIALLVCGVAMIAAGLLDHRQLVRGLGAPRQP